MRAFVFPGQGAQSIGMGKALALAYPAAKAVFDEVDDALGQNLSKLIWDGDINTLTLTENAQPALMATSIAALYALKAEGVALETASFVEKRNGKHLSISSIELLQVQADGELVGETKTLSFSISPVGIKVLV